MEISFEELPNYSEQFEEFIPDDAICVSVKVNLDEGEYDNKFTPPFYSSIVKYLDDSGVAILASTAGVHLQGKNQVPHIHYHFVCSNFRSPSNPSQHRQRWLSKNGNEIENLGSATFKYQKLDSRYPRFQFLSYPMKEGLLVRDNYYTYDGCKMKKEIRDFLVSVGQTIFQTSQALKLKNDLSVQRKQLALSELYDLCKTQSFPNFKSMLLWLDKNYIQTLDLEDYPDPKNYKTNSQKVAVKLGLLKYSDMCV